MLLHHLNVLNVLNVSLCCRASDDPEKTNTSYVEESQPTTHGKGEKAGREDKDVGREGRITEGDEF